MWGIQLTTIGQAIKYDPDLRLLESHQHLRARFLSWFFSLSFTRNVIPPGFRKTMGPPDARLPEMALGVGLISDNIQRFYPLAAIGDGIVDIWQKRPLRIGVNVNDGIPEARFEDGSRPLQLFTRWYGFAYTFPGAEIYSIRSNV